MSMSLEEIADHIEIQNLLTDYCTFVDAREFEKLRDIFSADAHIDYRGTGGEEGTTGEAIAFLERAFPLFANTQHLIGNMRIHLNGDSATARTMCYNPLEFDVPDAENKLVVIGLWYVDELIRTEQGWRISDRRQEKSYAFEATLLGGK
jgi:hypothetical protein